MLGYRLRRWPNIKTTFGQRLVFAGTAKQAHNDIQAMHEYTQRMRIRN